MLKYHKHAFLRAFVDGLIKNNEKEVLLKNIHVPISRAQKSYPTVFMTKMAESYSLGFTYLYNSYKGVSSLGRGSYLTLSPTVFFLSQTIYMYIPFPQRCCALTTEIPYWVLYFPLKKFSNILSPWNIHFHSLFLTPSKLYSVFYYYLDCPLLFPWILCALLTNNN